MPKGMKGFQKGHPVFGGKKFEVGHKPWNKGTKGLMRANCGGFKEGHGMNKGKENPMFGKVPWNKGKKWDKESCKKMSISHKTSKKAKEARNKLFKEMEGKHSSPATEFKKGHIPINGFKKGNRPKNFKGRIKNYAGYIGVHKPEHPYVSKNNNVLEHRLVVESQIKRYLKPKEMVHHINKIKDDNRPENLMAFVNRSAHVRFEANYYVKPSEIIFDGRKIKH